MAGPLEDTPANLSPVWFLSMPLLSFSKGLGTISSSHCVFQKGKEKYLGFPDPDSEGALNLRKSINQGEGFGWLGDKTGFWTLFPNICSGNVAELHFPFLTMQWKDNT